MAKKITAIVCGVSWAIFGISHLFVGPMGALAPAGVAMFVAGMMVGIFSLTVLGVLALIDYGRRPR